MALIGPADLYFAKVFFFPTAVAFVLQKSSHHQLCTSLNQGPREAVRSKVDGTTLHGLNTGPQPWRSTVITLLCFFFWCIIAQSYKSAELRPGKFRKVHIPLE